MAHSDFIARWRRFKGDKINRLPVAYTAGNGGAPHFRHTAEDARGGKKGGNASRSEKQLASEKTKKGIKTMFGKPKTAADILKLIEDLPEEEFEKLLAGLDEEEKETEEKVEETEEKAEEATGETAEEAEEASAESVEEAEETTAEETTAEETPEEEPVAEPEEEAEEVVEEKTDDLKEAYEARIASLEDLVSKLTERVDNIVDASENKAFGGETPKANEGETDTESEAERNYFAKVTRR